MKKIVPFFLILITFASCSTVMLTGRKQLSLVSDTEMNQMSFTAYSQLKDSLPLSTDKTNTAMVKRVGTNISNAVEAYMKQNGMQNEIANFQWEYTLFKDNQVNAFAMPGGKVAVYDGILAKTKTEAGMAVVIGHEIAHVVAKHSAERYSQQMAAQYGGSVLGAVVGGTSTAVQNGVGLLYGIGGQMMLLKYSRNQEYEADELGLIFMAMAGYDPNEAVAFWTRMTDDTSKSTVDFMSTHPSDDKRIAKLQEAIPKAMQYYKKSSGTFTVK